MAYYISLIVKVEGSYESLVHLLKQQNCEEQCLNFKHVQFIMTARFFTLKDGTPNSGGRY